MAQAGPGAFSELIIRFVGQIDQFAKSVMQVKKSLLEIDKAARATGKSTKKLSQEITETGDKTKDSTIKMGEYFVSFGRTSVGWIDRLAARTRDVGGTLRAMVLYVGDSLAAIGSGMSRVEIQQLRLMKEWGIHRGLLEEMVQRGDETARMFLNTANKAKALGVEVMGISHALATAFNFFDLIKRQLGWYLGAIGLFALIGGFGALVREIIRANDALMRLRVMLEDARQATINLREVNQQLWREAIRTASSVSEVGDAIFLLGQAGLQSQEALEALPPIMDMIRIFNLRAESTVIGLVGTWNVYREQLKNLGPVQKQFRYLVDLISTALANSTAEMSSFIDGLGYVASFAERAGFSLEQTSAILAVLNDRLIRGSRAGTGLRRVMMGLSREVYRLAAITGYELDRTRTLGEQFNDMMRHFSQYAKQSQMSLIELTEYLEAFGLRGAEPFAAILLGADKILDLLENKLPRATGFSERAMQHATGRISDQFKRLFNMVAAFGDKIVDLNALLGSTVTAIIAGIGAVAAKIILAGRKPGLEAFFTRQEIARIKLIQNLEVAGETLSKRQREMLQELDGAMKALNAYYRSIAYNAQAYGLFTRATWRAGKRLESWGLWLENLGERMYQVSRRSQMFSTAIDMVGATASMVSRPFMHLSRVLFGLSNVVMSLKMPFIELWRTLAPWVKWAIYIRVFSALAGALGRASDAALRGRDSVQVLKEASEPIIKLVNDAIDLLQGLSKLIIGLGRVTIGQIDSIGREIDKIDRKMNKWFRNFRFNIKDMISGWKLSQALSSELHGAIERLTSIGMIQIRQLRDYIANLTIKSETERKAERQLDRYIKAADRLLKLYRDEKFIFAPTEIADALDELNNAAKELAPTFWSLSYASERFKEAGRLLGEYISADLVPRITRSIDTTRMFLKAEEAYFEDLERQAKDSVGHIVDALRKLYHVRQIDLRASERYMRQIENQMRQAGERFMSNATWIQRRLETLRDAMQTTNQRYLDIFWQWVQNLEIKRGTAVVQAARIATRETYNLWLEAARNTGRAWDAAMADLAEGALNIAKQLQSNIVKIFQTMTDQLTDVIYNFLMKGRLTFEDFLRRMGETIVRMVAQLAAATIVRQGLFGMGIGVGMPGGAWAGLGGWRQAFTGIPGGGILQLFRQALQAVTSFQEGGYVTVPGMVHPGEFVVRREVVEQVGRSTLEALNRGQVGSTVIQINAVDARSFFELLQKNASAISSIVGEQILGNRPIRTNVLQRV